MINLSAQSISLDSKQKKHLRYAAFALVALALLWLTLDAIPKRLITIGVGPVGGAYYDMGLKYKEFLEKKGYRVSLVPIDETEQIVHRVNDRRSEIDVGFSAQDLRKENLDNTVSFGQIQIQPIFVFSRRSIYPRGVHSFSDLKGMNLVLPPERSVTSQAVLEIFKQFHIDQKNTRITFLPLGDAVAQLKEERFDTGLFMLSASNEYVVDLAKSAHLSLDSLSEIDSIAKKFPFLRRASLPQGIYDLDKTIPPMDTPLLAAKVSLVVKKDIPPATAYALLEAMSETHRYGNYVSMPGEFPSFVGTDLPLHPLIADFQRSGTPWIFANLPIALASVVNKYLVAFLAIWVLVGIRREIEELTGLRKFLLETVFKSILRRIQRAHAHGKPLTMGDIWTIEKISAWVERDEERTNLKTLISHLNATNFSSHESVMHIPGNASANAEQGKAIMEK